MPRQGQHPTPVFLRDLERDIPKSVELLHRRHDANLNPCHGNKNPNHALSTISVDNSVHTIMNGNPIRQRTIAIRNPDCNPDQQYATQPIDNPHKRRALYTTVMRQHTLSPQSFFASAGKVSDGVVEMQGHVGRKPKPLRKFPLVHRSAADRR